MNLYKITTCHKIWESVDDRDDYDILSYEFYDIKSKHREIRKNVIDELEDSGFYYIGNNEFVIDLDGTYTITALRFIGMDDRLKIILRDDKLNNLLG